MNKTKFKNKNLIICILWILTGVVAIFGGVRLIQGNTRLATAQVEVTVADEIKSAYAFGDKLTIPACTFVKEGKSAVGQSSLQYPSGVQTNKTEVSLNQSGQYALRYMAKIDGKTYVKQYDFTVKGRLASYASEKTSIQYGVCNQLGANSTGLMVRIANGDALAFDHVYDMRELSMADKLLEGFVVPTAHGSTDFAKMVFTFTDVEDPSVYMSFQGNFYDDINAHGLTYFTAGGNGQVQCGLEYVGKLHVGSNQGCMVAHSFMARDTGLYWGAQAPKDVAPDFRQFCISYDYNSNQAWAGGKIISDLDDSNYYDTLWTGFPSGKAKLTISAMNYNSATANMCFTSILGVDLSAESYLDKEVPAITVDNDGYERMPNAVVGGSYPVPAATAWDMVNGECKANVSVWYNYGMQNQKMVDVTGGRFAVNSVGTYAIVYEATDSSGNVAREVLWVRAELSMYAPKLTVKLDGAAAKTVEVGTVQILPQATVEGGSGNKTVAYTLSKGSTHYDVTEETFRLLEKGEWTLTCTATDYVGNTAVAVCKLNGVVSGNPIAIDTPNVPTAYISGATYTLPMLYAYDYTSGAEVQKVCDVRVEYDGKTQNYQAGGSFTPVVKNHLDTMKLVYTCGGATLYETDVPVLSVFDKERIPGASERYRDVISVEKYFYTQDDLTLTNQYTLLDVNGLLIQANTAADNAKLVFANEQMASAFSLDMMTVPNAAKYSKMRITLTDSADRNVSVAVTLAKDDGQTLLTVGETQLSLLLDLDSASATAYSIGFAKDSLVINSTTLVPVKQTENGQAFNGFPSGKIYFTIELCDVEAGAAIFVSKISSVNVDNKQDSTGAVITTANALVTTAVKDSVYTVQKVFVGDALCPNVQTTLTVMSPSKQIVTSVDGVELKGVDATREYQINLTEYGQYYISVSAAESGWKYTNTSHLEYVVTVVDGVPPTIAFDDDFETELEVGDLLEIPEYEVSDNYSPSDKITVMIMVVNPKGMPVYLYGTEPSMRCEYAGIYKVYVYVYDAIGNLTTYETEITVEE